MNVESRSPLTSPPGDYCPPGSARWFELPTGLDAGKKLFYFDFQTRHGQPAEHTILFVHGNPECSYTYRGIHDALMASRAPLRLVAPDHIGFGLSDPADFEMVDKHHAANLAQLVSHLNLQNVTLVVHDWGGPIGIGALLEMPERVNGLVVLNSTVFPMPADGITYRNYPFPWLPWHLTPRLIPDRLWGGVAAAVVRHAHPQGTASFLALTARWLRRFAMNAIAPGTPEHVFSQMLRHPMNARSSKRNVLQTPVWGHGYRYRDSRHGVQDNHEFYAGIQARLPRCWGPDGRDIAVCGYFGQWDACGKASVIAQWQRALPQMKRDTQRFPDIGHFIEEYKGPEIARSILRMHELA